MTARPKRVVKVGAVGDGGVITGRLLRVTFARLVAGLSVVCRDGSVGVVSAASVVHTAGVSASSRTIGSSGEKQTCLDVRRRVVPSGSRI